MDDLIENEDKCEEILNQIISENYDNFNHILKVPVEIGKDYEKIKKNAL
jgi:hypothetical protein